MKKALCVIGAVVAVGLCACSASGAAGQSGEIAVPEYGWDLDRDALVQALTDAGADVTDTDIYVSAVNAALSAENVELFGVPAESAAFTFGADGTLKGVSWKTSDGEALRENMVKAFGDPLESYRPVVLGGTLGGDDFAVQQSSEMVSDGVAIWHSAQSLADLLTENEKTAFVDRLKGNYPMEEKDPTESEVNGETCTTWYGTEAVDQFLANNWEKTALYAADGTGANVQITCYDTTFFSDLADGAGAAETAPLDFTCLNDGVFANYRSTWAADAETLSFTVDLTDPAALKGTEVFHKDGCTITITDVTDVEDVSCTLHMQATGVCENGHGTLYTLYLPAQAASGTEQQATLQTEPDAFRCYFTETSSDMTATGNEFALGVFHAQDTPDTTATVTAGVFRLTIETTE